MCVCMYARVCACACMACACMHMCMCVHMPVCAHVGGQRLILGVFFYLFFETESVTELTCLG